MKHKRLLPRLMALFLCMTASQFLIAGDSDAPLLVTPAWLSAHINDPDMVVLNVAQGARAYRLGHIPSARFLWVNTIAASNPELSFELVPLEQLDSLMEGLGISNSSRIILCGVNGNVSATARTYITLEYLGMGGRTSILDGGFEGWKAAGHPISTTTPDVKRSSFTPHPRSDAIVNSEYVKTHMNVKGVAVVDARAPNFYKGIGGGNPRPGHIPGAHNVFYATLYDSTDKFLPLDTLRTRFEIAGVKSDDDVITYCHVGQTASSAYLAAKLLGHQVHLYDGSFEDWSSREDLPVVVETKNDPAKK